MNPNELDKVKNSLRDLDKYLDEVKIQILNNSDMLADMVNSGEVDKENFGVMLNTLVKRPLFKSLNHVRRTRSRLGSLVGTKKVGDKRCP